MGFNPLSPSLALALFLGANSALAAPRFVLIDADQDVALGDLSNGATIDLNKVTSSLNIQVIPQLTGVVRVNFDLNGSTTSEGTAPYAMRGDNSGNYNVWTPALGSYTLKVSLLGSNGASLETASIQFTVARLTAPPPPSPTPSPTAAAVSSDSNVCASVNEGSTATLACPTGQVATAVGFASYGTPSGSCGGFQTSSCNAANSRSSVEAACLGKASCSVQALNSVFGDPCANVYKSMKIQLTCGSGTVAAPSPPPVEPDEPNSTPVNDPPNSVVFYDGGEYRPVINWPTSKRQGYMMVTGGTQVFGDTNSASSITLATEGSFEGAPKPRAGTSSYRMRVEKRTDYPPCCNWTRSELYWGNGGDEVTGAEYFALSIYVPSNWVHDNRPIQMGYDMKFPNAVGPASFNLKMEDGQWQASRQFPQGANEERVNFAPVAKGEWTDFVVHRNFTPDSSKGFLRVYMNGSPVPVYEYYGANYPGGESYMLLGLYKWSYATPDGQGEGSGSYNGPITAYYDEIKVGNANATLQSMWPKTPRK